ncbi:GNAT family N-acetyltransferase [Longivirga aurantiaca]|uniref:GNAT family N-acetyltransferase n=1 Tax=Longivirga aurantiaca TaxID=1837743 RepID=A0ABW1T0V2_9ACTN
MTGYGTPSLGTARLALSPYTEDDRAAFVALLGQDSVTCYMGDGEPMTEVASVSMFTKVLDEIYPAGSWPIWCVREGGRLVGHAEVKPSPGERIDGWEVVYALDPSVWGRGLGTELVVALTAYAHDALGLVEVHATVDPANTASLDVLVRVGYIGLPDIDEDGELTRHLVHRS